MLPVSVQLSLGRRGRLAQLPFSDEAGGGLFFGCSSDKRRDDEPELR